jgi:hypothetical protein
MATRASIKVKDINNNTICTIYKHYDGYPSGIQKDIEEIISNGQVVNGLSIEKPVLGAVFNGFGCFVSSLISLIKTNPGDVYLIPESDYGNRGEDYLYIIKETEEGIKIKQKHEWDE